MLRTCLLAFVFLLAVSSPGHAQTVSTGCPISGMTLTPYGTGGGYPDPYGVIGFIPSLSGAYDPSNCVLTLNLSSAPFFVESFAPGQIIGGARSGQFLVVGNNTAGEVLPNLTGLLLVELGEILDLGPIAPPTLSISIPPYVVPGVDVFLQYFPVYDVMLQQVPPPLPPLTFTLAFCSAGLQLTTF